MLNMLGNIRLANPVSAVGTTCGHLWQLSTIMIPVKQTDKCLQYKRFNKVSLGPKFIRLFVNENYSDPGLTKWRFREANGPFL